jgi:hypothetical protein
MSLLAELETAEYRAVDALGRMALHDPRRAAIQALLAKARTAKASLLVGSDTLRKNGSRAKLRAAAGGDCRAALMASYRGVDDAYVGMIKSSLAAQRAREKADPGSGTDNQRLYEWFQRRDGRWRRPSPPPGGSMSYPLGRGAPNSGATNPLSGATPLPARPDDLVRGGNGR